MAITSSESRRMIRERALNARNGLAVAVILLLGIVAAVWWIAHAGNTGQPASVARAVIILVVLVTRLGGLCVVNPNEGKVGTLFGRYIGAEKREGLWFVNPFTRRRRISLRVRNFETTKLKVNDAHSNPIETAAIVVWKTVETAQAACRVDD